MELWFGALAAAVAAIAVVKGLRTLGAPARLRDVIKKDIDICVALPVGPTRARFERSILKKSQRLAVLDDGRLTRVQVSLMMILIVLVSPVLIRAFAEFYHGFIDASSEDPTDSAMSPQRVDRIVTVMALLAIPFYLATAWLNHRQNSELRGLKKEFEAEQAGDQ